MRPAIGIDIGGTNLRIGVAQGTTILYENRFTADFSSICKQHSPQFAWQEILRLTMGAVQDAVSHHPEVKSIGIGFPGFIDPASGRIAQSPNLPGLRSVDLAGDLTELLRLPVVVENDALVAAYGEYLLHGEPQKSLAYIGLGTGVGGGLIHAGKPFPGDHGIAMEIGHLIVDPGGRPCGCGNQGCLEQYASASGVAISYEKLSGKYLPTALIAELAKQEDALALQAFRQAGISLAMGVAHLIKILDVENILIGGGLSQAWMYMKDAFQQQLDHDLIPVLKRKNRIIISQSGDKGGIIGAAYLSAGHH
ncbi:ROK family protein [Methylobacillus caricis]|uniref:ROK family protein n=1 Tax=Methylobacillus caricis TaxID=1971611 RepID=UPI001CFFD460|nr:ROK family protein [Methylobacillus caricis]MCB5187550.1 ROK family protein [Methylobacillus caricis]